MTLDINELERLHAEAQDEQRNGATMLAISGPVHGTALVGYSGRQAFFHRRM